MADPLYARVQEGPTFRFTTSEVTVQPSPCLSYRIPRDFVDLSAGEDAYKLIDFLKLVGFTFSYSQSHENRHERKKKPTSPEQNGKKQPGII